jgi:hypothetical protein
MVDVNPPYTLSKINLYLTLTIGDFNHEKFSLFN